MLLWIFLVSVTETFGPVSPVKRLGSKPRKPRKPIKKKSTTVGETCIGDPLIYPKGTPTYLVTPGFPAKYTSPKPYKCQYTIQSNEPSNNCFEGGGSVKIWLHWEVTEYGGDKERKGDCYPIKIDICGQITSPWLCDNKRMPIDMFFSVSTIVIKMNVKSGFFGSRFKMNIQEVPAEFANQASQIIEEARLSGSYPVLPTLDGYLAPAEPLEEGQMRGQRALVAKRGGKNAKKSAVGKKPKQVIGGKIASKAAFPSKFPSKLKSAMKRPLNIIRPVKKPLNINTHQSGQKRMGKRPNPDGQIRKPVESGSKINYAVLSAVVLITTILGVFLYKRHLEKTVKKTLPNAAEDANPPKIPSKESYAPPVPPRG